MPLLFVSQEVVFGDGKLKLQNDARLEKILSFLDSPKRLVVLGSSDNSSALSDWIKRLGGEYQVCEAGARLEMVCKIVRTENEAAWLWLDISTHSVDEFTGAHCIIIDPTSGIKDADVEVAQLMVRNAAACEMGKKLSGKVKRYNANRGFGFVTSEAGKDYFVHQSDVKMEGFRALNEGAPVRFIVSFVQGREQAVAVEQLTEYVPRQQRGSPAGKKRATQGQETTSAQSSGERDQPAVIPLVPHGAGWQAPNGTVYYGMVMMPQLPALGGPLPFAQYMPTALTISPPPPYTKPNNKEKAH